MAADGDIVQLVGVLHGAAIGLVAWPGVMARLAVLLGGAGPRTGDDDAGPRPAARQDPRRPSAR